MTDYQIFTHSGGGAQTPEFSSANNPAGAHTLGLRSTISDAGYQATELHYWVPLGGLAVLTAAYAQLWNETAGTKLAEVNLLLEPTPSANAWMTVVLDGTRGPLSTPVVLSTGVNYFVCSFTDGSPGQYTFRQAGATLPFGNGPLSASLARYRNGGTKEQLPDSDFAGAWFFSDLTVSLAAQPPVSRSLFAWTRPHWWTPLRTLIHRELPKAAGPPPDALATSSSAVTASSTSATTVTAPATSTSTVTGG